MYYAWNRKRAQDLLYCPRCEMTGRTPQINFRSIRSVGAGQHEGFEEFCCELARHAVRAPQGSTFLRFRGAGGDGGVECIWKLPNGEEWGFQAKYLFGLDKRQLDNSVATALTIHPNLSRYIICIPFDLSGPTSRPGKSQYEKYENYKAQWEILAEGRGMSVEFVLWSRSELGTRLLTIDGDLGRTRYWFDQMFFTDQWFTDRIRETTKAAEPRYTPDLTVDVPIHQAFEALGRTPIWEQSVRDLTTRVRRLAQEWLRSIDSSNQLVPELPASAREQAESLVDSLEEVGQLLEALMAEGDEEKLQRLCKTIESARTLASGCLSISIEALEAEHGKGSADSEGFRQYMAEYMVSFPAAHVDLSRETLELLLDLESWLEESGQLSIAPAALVVGPAGIGKTHSICDIALDRLERGLKSVVLLGQQFSEGEPWEQIRQLLGLSGPLSRDEFLGALNVAAETTGCPAIIFIDALNETVPRDLWRRHLAAFVQQVSRYEWLKVCFSCRSTYVDDVIPDGYSITRIQHSGFEGVEFEACFSFFEYYNLEPPSMPVLQPEFSNPLFLRLVCESLRDAGVTRFPDRMLGLSEVVSCLVDSKEAKIARLLDYNPKEQRVRQALDLLVSQMHKNQSRWIDWKEAKAICDSVWPSSRRSASLFDQLIREGIISEDRVARPAEESPTDVVRFSFERLGDYMLAEKHLRDLDTEVRAAFEKGGRLHFLVKDHESIRRNLGLLEALAILLPERYGTELTDILQVGHSQEILSATVKSVTWRDPSSITTATQSAMRSALARQNTFDEAMEALLSVSTRPLHPLNSFWFHSLAMSLAMPQRDAWLGPYLHRKYGESTAVNRLIDWGLRAEADAIPEEIAALWVTQLGWFFVASDRRVRDNATKAAIKIMESSGAKWPEIIERFSEVDDEYVIERVLAAVYGSLVRSRNRSHLEGAADCIYGIFFAERKLPQNAMVRDYGRMILELALHEGALANGIAPKTFRPPYDSEWPLSIPDQAFVEQYKDSYRDLPKLFRSCFHDDFNKYTIGSAIRPYDGITLAEAARWVFKEVLDMGYSKHLHRGFDGYIVSKYGPGRGKPDWAERIGKKYQWIALYRLLARLGDNAALKDDLWGQRPHDLQARSEKDIDPTILIRSTKKDGKKRSWWSSCEYDFDAQESSSDDEWLSTFDFPDSAQMVLVTDPKDGTDYYVLLAYPEWSSRGEERHMDLDHHYRLLWMHIRSYLVRKQDSEPCWKWIKKQDFMGRWMPEGADLYEHFVGEYPWAPPFRAHFEEYPEWTRTGGSSHVLPVGMLLTSHALLSEQGYDATKEENFSIEVPADAFFCRCNLSWHGAGSYLTEDGKIAFRFPAVHEPGPYALLAEREFLETLLKENGLVLIWTVLAEKQCIRGWSGNALGYTKHSRAHMLREGRIASSAGVTERVAS